MKTPQEYAELAETCIEAHRDTKFSVPTSGSPHLDAAYAYIRLAEMANKFEVR